MKKMTRSLDEKLEAWFEAIPPVIQKYFFLLSFVAGLTCLLLSAAGIIFVIIDGRIQRKVEGVVWGLAAFVFFVWATREMFHAFKGVQLNRVNPKIN